jgi:hypothetical protein
MLDDLREQMIQEEEARELEQERRPRVQIGFIQNMAPWQRLVLAVLVFLDVALCGWLALIMLGRVSLPL